MAFSSLISSPLWVTSFSSPQLTSLFSTAPSFYKPWERSWERSRPPRPLAHGTSIMSNSALNTPLPSGLDWSWPTLGAFSQHGYSMIYRGLGMRQRSIRRSVCACCGQPSLVGGAKQEEGGGTGRQATPRELRSRRGAKETPWRWSPGLYLYTLTDLVLLTVLPLASQSPLHGKVLFCYQLCLLLALFSLLVPFRWLGSTLWRLRCILRRCQPMQ